MRFLSDTQRQVMFSAVEAYGDIYEAMGADSHQALQCMLESQCAKAAQHIDLVICKEIGEQAEEILILRNKLKAISDFKEYLRHKTAVDVKCIGFCECIRSVEVAILIVSLETWRDTLFDRLQNVLPKYVPDDLVLTQVDVDAARRIIGEISVQLCDAEQMVQYFTDNAKTSMYT